MKQSTVTKNLHRNSYIRRVDARKVRRYLRSCIGLICNVEQTTDEDATNARISIVQLGKVLSSGRLQRKIVRNVKKLHPQFY
ncbi:MAG TPA: hypothetical protein VFW49_14960 [Fluviicoccus sp.]|nr:hypothetical protein [Fluviicoccus sp.]